MADIVSLDSYRGQNGTVRAGTGRPAGGPGGQAGSGAQAPQVFFDRREFDLILRLYGAMVAAGEWRDYAISHDSESCTFAVYRRTADGALYRIVKAPRLAKKQGAYAVIGVDGRVLKRGRSLAQTLGVFERRLMKLVDAD